MVLASLVKNAAASSVMSGSPSFNKNSSWGSISICVFARSLNALFLRAWAAHEQNSCPEDLFGLKPKANIFITHDVDAIKKTIPIHGGYQLFDFYCKKAAGITFQSSRRPIV